MAQNVDTEVETITPEHGSPVGAPQGKPRRSEDYQQSPSEYESEYNESETAYGVPRDINRQKEYSDSESESFYSDDGPAGKLACCCGLPSCFRFKSTEDVSRYRVASNTVLIHLAIILFVTGSCLWGLIGYFAPKCFCGDAYEHIASTQSGHIAILISSFFYLSTFFGLSYKTVSSMMRYDVAPLMAVTIFCTLTCIISTCLNLYSIFQVGGWTTYNILQGDYSAKFINADIFKFIDTFSDKDTSEIAESILTPMAFNFVQSAERVFKFWCIGGWFVFNLFLLATVVNLRQYRKCQDEYDEDEMSDSKSCRSYNSRHSSRSRSSIRSRQSGKSRRTNRSDYPPKYRDISPPPRSEISSRSKKSAFSTRMKPVHKHTLIHEYTDEPSYLTMGSAPGVRQSFAQNALSKRSRASVACADLAASVNSYCDAPSYISSTAPRVGGGYRPKKNISAREDFLLQP